MLSRWHIPQICFLPQKKHIMSAGVVRRNVSHEILYQIQLIIPNDDSNWPTIQGADLKGNVTAVALEMIGVIRIIVLVYLFVVDSIADRDGANMVVVVFSCLKTLYFCWDYPLWTHDLHRK